jgi:transposase
VQAIAECCPELARLRDQALEFRRIFRDKDSAAFDRWLVEAEKGLLRGFATSLKSDLAAVRAAVELPWSNRPTEGHVNRLKLIKRSMFGRAGFELLRERVLHVA